MKRLTSPKTGSSTSPYRVPLLSGSRADMRESAPPPPRVAPEYQQRVIYAGAGSQPSPPVTGPPPGSPVLTSSLPRSLGSSLGAGSSFAYTPSTTPMDLTASRPSIKKMLASSTTTSNYTPALALSAGSAASGPLSKASPAQGPGRPTGGVMDRSSDRPESVLEVSLRSAGVDVGQRTSALDKSTKVTPSVTPSSLGLGATPTGALPQASTQLTHNVASPSAEKASLKSSASTGDLQQLATNLTTKLDSVAFTGTIEELLARQLVVVEQAMAFNHVITQRLKSEGSKGAESIPREFDISIGKPEDDGDGGVETASEVTREAASPSPGGFGAATSYPLTVEEDLANEASGVVEMVSETTQTDAVLISDSETAPGAIEEIILSGDAGIPYRPPESILPEASIDGDEEAPSYVVNETSPEEAAVAPDDKAIMLTEPIPFPANDESFGLTRQTSGGSTSAAEPEHESAGDGQHHSKLKRLQTWLSDVKKPGVSSRENLPQISRADRSSSKVEVEHSHGHRKKGGIGRGRHARVKRSDQMTHIFPRAGDIAKTESPDQSVVRAEDFYMDRGCFQALARSSWFSTSAMILILLNTIWIAVDTDNNKVDILCQAPMLYQVVDNLFCLGFSFEIFVRLFALRNKCFVFRDAWFMFDAFLVALMIWETWVLVFLYSVLGFSVNGGNGRAASVLRIFRVFRLTRVARTARLLNSIPELLILAKGIIVSMRSVFIILCLLMLVIYIFAIIFVEILDESELKHEKFENVIQSMMYLLIQVLCGFDPDFLTTMYNTNILGFALMLMYLLLSQLTILNMLIGILCDVVSTVADVEKEEAFVRDMETKVESLVESMDSSGDGCVTKVEFEEVLKRPELISSLTEMGVDVIGLMDFASFVFNECEELSYNNLLHMVLKFRGAKTATVKDVMDMRKQLSMQHTRQMETYSMMTMLITGVKEDEAVELTAPGVDGIDES